LLTCASASDDVLTNAVVLTARRLGGVACAALALCLGAASASCAAQPAGAVHETPRDRSPRLDDAFDGEPAFLLVFRPTRLRQDPLYGPLLRRAGELASTRAALAEAVGTTMLEVMERTDEVIVGTYDRDARNVVVALRGVPADVEASHVLETSGQPVWTHARDLPGGIEELASTDAPTDAALFALPRRAWVIALHDAIPRARAAYAEGARGAPARLGAVADEPLVVARLRGDALVRARPSLADGPLAPMVRGLDTVIASVEPGPQGAVGEIVARFVYEETPFAEHAEQCAGDVLAAFTHKFEAKAPWLHAVKVSREERAVIVRGRIPRAWADGFIHVDLDDLAK
jgi:hypothetical protein